MKNYRNRLTIQRLVVHTLLIALAVVCLLPLFFCLKVSLEPKELAFSPPVMSWRDPSFRNYIEIFARQDLMVPRWFVNSIVVSTSIVVLQLVVVSMAAYAFARLKFPGRDLLFMTILFTMMIPGQVTMIPVYLSIRRFGLLDNYLGLIMPVMANVFGVFLLRQFFLSIPGELEEAAMIDGVGRFTTFFRIMLPQAKPGLVALGILTFLGSWNDLFWPLIIMNKLEMRTLTVGLTVLNGTYSTERSIVLAGAFIAIVPALVIYGIFQRKIIEGTMLSGIGGR